MFRGFSSFVRNGSSARFSTLISIPQGATRSPLFVLGVGCGVGVLALSAVQLARGASISTQDEEASMSQDQFPAAVRRRLQGAYGYVAASCAGTAALASVFFRSYRLQSLMMSHPIITGIGGVVLMFGSMMATRSLDYYESPILKHVALGTFAASQALMLSPLAVLGGPLLMRAAVATGAIVGGVSLTAATAPSQAYLNLAAPITIGAMLVTGASLGSIFFPASNLLYSVVLWGGLGLHGFMLFSRTQSMIDGAYRRPNGRFDPINDCLGVYIDTVAIFWRMAMILSNGGGMKKRN